MLVFTSITTRRVRIGDFRGLRHSLATHAEPELSLGSGPYTLVGVRAANESFRFRKGIVNTPLCQGNRIRMCIARNYHQLALGRRGCNILQCRFPRGVRGRIMCRLSVGLIRSGGGGVEALIVPIFDCNSFRRASCKLVINMIGGAKKCLGMGASFNDISSSLSPISGTSK